MSEATKRERPEQFEGPMSADDEHVARVDVVAAVEGVAG